MHPYLIEGLSNWKFYIVYVSQLKEQERCTLTTPVYLNQFGIIIKSIQLLTVREPS
jgi:hypothetical protein